MASTPAAPAVVPPPRVYNAIYSAVQVYECMVRGIAVMRRRVDSYVNATQILKVAGIDKGRRTKILEKEILPGKHEIVQGGYGKYQGTWIPLERGRDVAQQFGVAPLLAPLFDHKPLPAPMQHPRLPPGRLPQAHPYYHPHPMQPHYVAPPPQSHLPFHHPPPQHLVPGGPRHPQFIHQPYQLPMAGGSANPFKPSLGRPLSSTGTPQLHPTYLYPGTPNPYSIKPPSGPPAKRPREDGTPQAGTSKNGAKKDAQTTSEKSGDAPDGGKPSPAKRPRTGATSESNSINSYNFPGGVLNVAGPPSQLPVDPSTRFSTKALPASPGDQLAPLRNARCRAIVASISQDAADPAVVLDLLQNPEGVGPVPPDVDVVVDDQGHTSLHWAAALSRLSLIETLVQAGADIHRGNDCGETPLIRAILSPSSFTNQTFPQLLLHFSASLRTVDSSSRSVLHHIALVAGVKTRAPSARYYMECVLEHVARNEGGDKALKGLVNLQDIHGDTALNVAARVGNRSLVRNLIDVGANKLLANKLGLRPGDFGVEGESLQVPKGSDIVSSLQSTPSLLVQKSQDVIADMTAMIQTLNTDFSAELKVKQDVLNTTQTELRAATRELAEQRRQIQKWQTECSELDKIQQRMRNVERAMKEEDDFDWIAAAPNKGTVIDGKSIMSADSGAGFEVTLGLEVDPPLPTVESVDALIKLRRLALWHTKVDEIMIGRLAALKGSSAEKEFQCKKIVSLCTGVPLEKVESMLENLVIAMESDGTVPELGRVAGFMQKVRTDA